MTSVSVILSDGDLLALIFLRLHTITELGCVAQCCRLWRSSSSSNQVWQSFVYAAFPSTRDLVGVHSYKALHARLKGFDPTRIASKLANYQFMIVLLYEGHTVLQVTLQGGAATMQEPEQPNDKLREMHIAGESYHVPIWNLDANMDLAWLSNTRAEAMNDAAIPYERLKEDVLSFLDASHDDYEVGTKLVLSITAFRASDQRTTLLMHSSLDTASVPGYSENSGHGGVNLIFTSQPQAKVYPGRHRRKAHAYPDFETDELALMCNLEASKGADAADPICWDFAMHLHCDILPASEDDMPERIGVPTAEYLRYLEGASWV